MLCISGSSFIYPYKKFDQAINESTPERVFAIFSLVFIVLSVILSCQDTLSKIFLIAENIGVMDRKSESSLGCSLRVVAIIFFQSLMN